MAGETGKTTSRLLNKLQYDIANVADTITTASGDFLLVADITDDYKVGKVAITDLTLTDVTAITSAVTVGSDGTGFDVTFFSATAGKKWLWDESADKMIVTGASDFLGAVTVGVDDAGHDVIFYGATAGQKVFWDESADTLNIDATTQADGTLTVGVDDTGYDVKFFGATTGKSWFWDESADKMIVTGTSTFTGDTQQTGTLTVGVDDTGYDVIFYGATTAKKFHWDESADTMILAGNATITGDIALNGSIQNTNTTAITAATGGSIPVLTFTDGLNLVSFTTNADDIVHLPTNVAGDVGKEIEIYAVQGFELRSADASATLNNVVIGATNECAFVAGTYAKLKCVADNTWLAVQSTLIDGTQTKLVPDAV